MIAILGPGGVGGLLAAALARAGEPVTVIARESTAELIERDGIRVESLFLGADFTARPAAATRITEPGATLVVATKATTLPDALDRVDAAPALVVPLLNGLDHMELLRERFPFDRVAAGVIRVEADRPAPGHITQTSPFLRVDMAPTERVTAFAAALERAGVPVGVSESEADVLWGKLVRLNALACVTSAHDMLLGPIRDDPERRAELDACIREAAAVAAAEGATGIDPGVVMAELDQAHATLGTSMQRDIAAGRAPELDALPGAVLRAGARHGIATPTIARLYDAIAARL